jgi:ankyrin repeat protein
VLLRHGASPDAFAPPAGATPLAWATLMGHDAVAQVLRDAGADEYAARACSLAASEINAG